IELTDSARLIGNVETKNITIASGAYFSGKCQMMNGEQQSALVPEESEEMVKGRIKNEKK
ncbi:polymer-forming cytoskeletal protein, partial [Patescibacteria group bacterium]|nr:polymer-forming cytoskeletal protein [Patescibacteria group bacterium]